MTNIQVLRNLCNAICNTFYADVATLQVSLFNEGIESDIEATPKDPALLKLAILLVTGYVESSKNENGISHSVDADRINDSIAIWCNDYGLDADEYLIHRVSVESGSNLW